MKHKVSELEGHLLDAAVARAENCALVEFGDDGGRTDFMPSENWAHGGPIIERQRITLHIFSNGSVAWLGDDKPITSIDFQGLEIHASDLSPTPLIAAMRAYVASKFGEEVELP